MASSDKQSSKRTQHNAANVAVARLLARWREEAGLSRRELAKRLRTSHTLINRIEGDMRRMDAIELLAWTRATGVDFIEAMRAIERAVDGLPHNWNIEPAKQGRGLRRGRPSDPQA